MRIILGALSLLVALAIVSWLSRTQLKAVATPVTVPMPDGGNAQNLNPKQVEQQYKKAIDDAMSTARQRSVEE